MTATAQKSYTWGTGRRKTAVARVRIREGTGQFNVNGLDVNEYFPLEVQRMDVRAPLTLTDMKERIDVFVNVNGSGKLSQSGAVMLGLARALKEYRPDFESALRDAGFLTRDSRMVERKKFGHKKARKSFQFSKR
ncbi:MAG: 30S ribosomal protein S9 [Isosphaeraceae bacterium]